MGRYEKPFRSQCGDNADGEGAHDVDRQRSVRPAVSPPVYRSGDAVPEHAPQGTASRHPDPFGHVPSNNSHLENQTHKAPEYGTFPPSGQSDVGRFTLDG